MTFQSGKGHDNLLGRCFHIQFLGCREHGDDVVLAKHLVMLAYLRFQKPSSQWFALCKVSDGVTYIGIEDGKLDICPSRQVLAKVLRTLHVSAWVPERILLHEVAFAPHLPTCGTPSLLVLEEVPFAHIGWKPLLRDAVEIYPAVLPPSARLTTRAASHHLRSSGDELDRGLVDVVELDARLKEVARWGRRVAGGGSDERPFDGGGRGVARPRPKQRMRRPRNMFERAVAVDDANEYVGGDLAPEMGHQEEEADFEPWELHFYRERGIVVPVREVMPAAPGPLPVAPGMASAVAPVLGVLPAVPPAMPPLLASPSGPAVPAPVLGVLPAVPPPPPEPPGPPGPPGAVLGRARAGERHHCMFGPFELAQLWTGGTFSGLSAKCRRHPPPPGARADLFCKTDMGFGVTDEAAALPHAEVQLKRWLIVGYSVPAELPDCRRVHMVENRARLLGPLSAAQRANAIATGCFSAADIADL